MAVAFVGVVLYLLAAVVLRRWLVLLVPTALIPLAYYAEHACWWGNCVSMDVDWWAYAVFFTVPVVAFTAVLIGIAKLVARIENSTKVVNIAASGIALGAIVIIVLATAG